MGEVCIGVLVVAVVAYILSRVSAARTQAVGNVSGPGEFDVEVVGESHYQQALERICGGRTRNGVEKYVTAQLVLEDSNRYDRMAVRVDIEGQTVGYLSRENAREYRRQLKRAGHPDLTVTCDALIRGGWDRGGGDTGNFGVRLDRPVD